VQRLQRGTVGISTAIPRLGVNVIAQDNGAGLSVDANLIIETARAAGIAMRWTRALEAPTALRALRKAGLLRFTPKPFAMNLFLEKFDPTFFPLAFRNVLIPNPEWFPMNQLENLSGIDLVLCKSRHAEVGFQELGHRVRYVGFTGRDRWAGQSAASQPMRALHVAGRSAWKGTTALLEVWRRHPEWPELTVVQRPSADNPVVDTTQSDNIRLVTARISEEELIQLQRSHPLFILPSEVEGYGQTLAEGMSVGAVVVTTDGAPMNEIVSVGRGALVPVSSQQPMRFGTRYLIETAALESTIASVMTWSVDHRVAIGTAARAWFTENDRRFRTAFPQAIRDTLR
jgi:glycosyltransferase involved in cell wall biosynthesis